VLQTSTKSREGNNAMNLLMLKKITLITQNAKVL